MFLGKICGERPEGKAYGFRKDTLREGYGKKKKASLLACLLRYP